MAFSRDLSLLNYRISNKGDDSEIRCKPFVQKDYGHLSKESHKPKKGTRSLSPSK